MITELQTRKLDRAFRQLDVDDDKYVERKDVVALATRIMSGFGELPTSEKGKRLLDAFDGFWQALIAETDHDHDGRISPQEWQAGMAGAFIEKGGGFDRILRPAAQAVLRMVDTDGDGAVKVDEFCTMQQAYGTPQEDAKLAFHAIDTNGDGSLSVDELVEAARQFYTSADETAAGNSLFGEI